ncbi:peptidoglycan DD-metalloendopeptidase family protein [Halovenus sp. WSH3]|uniref:Peptidoglycan DD-metalloendopeptidase family protein n=1 Tax=Halovenus carboxidivorans TaxID=2692199 RepID=A0A6B0T3X1_9EURY|nr:M23 family metallopeptidase [Halovenus carboxidivorans]MXR50173.1 peptidoglycan DD-metalloendopeptidase family protein [Halovenus carboxidivorans]
MSEQRASTDLPTRLRRLLRRADPTRLWLLGLVALPSYVVESLAFLRIFNVFFLAFLWIFLEPVVDAVLARGAAEQTEPTDWIGTGDWREWVVSYATLPLTFVNPILLVQDAFQFLGSAVAAVRHRGSLPARGDDRAVEYRLPVDGEWTVVNGSLDREFSHSWFPATQRYAYDFVITDEDGRTRPEGTAAAVENYYCHDEPVLAPADGVVVDVFETDLEPGRGGGFSHPLKRDIRGNYVTIQHAPGEFSCLAHLRPGSLTVEPGTTVERGEVIGRCGHTGNSSEPHLHFQLQDSPVFEMAAGLPVEFTGATTTSPWREETATPSTRRADSTAVSDGGTTAITAGQRVSQERVADSASTEYTVPDRRLTAALERTALGFAVGLLLAVFGGFVLEQPLLSAALGALGVAGVGGWAVLRRVRTARPGGVGLPLGLAIAATVWWIDPPVSALVLALSAGLVYAAVAEFDRVRSRRGFGSGEHRIH